MREVKSQKMEPLKVEFKYFIECIVNGRVDCV